MEALMGHALKQSALQRKTSVPWKQDEPHPQTYYAFDHSSSSWISRNSAAVESTIKTDSKTDLIHVFSWNIDFMLPFAKARMESALAHLNDLIEAGTSNAYPVIFLQECTSDDLDTICNTSWIRKRFHLTDVNTDCWATGYYGTLTLIDSRLPITDVFRVHYSKTRMDRDALFVDVSLGGRKVRLCNTHLESLALDPPFRPHQMQIAAKYMREDKVDASLIAGDFNAIQPFDLTLHVDNGLKDAFLELGGTEDAEEGYTWGQQAATKLREQFGCSRMDKLFFCGKADAVSFDRFGMDVLTAGEEEARQIIALGFEKAWVTDHLGIRVVLNISGEGKNRL